MFLQFNNNILTNYSCAILYCNRRNQDTPQSYEKFQNVSLPRNWKRDRVIPFKTLVKLVKEHPPCIEPFISYCCKELCQDAEFIRNAFIQNTTIFRKDQQETEIMQYVQSNRMFIIAEILGFAGIPFEYHETLVVSRAAMQVPYIDPIYDIIQKGIL